MRQAAGRCKQFASWAIIGDNGGMKQQPKSAWPFNPNFPEEFSFPAFGSAQWLELLFWPAREDDAAKVARCNKIEICSKKIKAGDWQYVWGEIYADNPFATNPPLVTETYFSMKKANGWVETLLDAKRFWQEEINVWAVQMTEKEFEKTNPNDAHVSTYAYYDDCKNRCKVFCHRFHIYQQARYRWHEHLLEKHCKRALGQLTERIKDDKKPKTALEARACLIGWLSQQRGNKEHHFVEEFTRRKPTSEKKAERLFFDKERCASSSATYRSTPDKMGWLILTWPIWNYYGWKWAHLNNAVLEKFRFDRDVVEHRGADIIKELCPRAAGRLHISERPRGRGANKNPPLWDFAMQISA